jgi:short subunit dehydrogenase-like uncharacterized protein
MSEIWILGATGRCGRAVAARLAAQQFSPVLVGRDTTRLRDIAAAIGPNVRTVTADSLDAIAIEIKRNKPDIVINTIGPFVETALPVARACMGGSHYIDISNELTSIVGLLALHDDAVASGRTFVTGAGFGVLATESVVLKLCEGQPSASKVRVDVMPTAEAEAGYFGSALAGSIVEELAAGGRHFAKGRLVRAGLFGDPETLTLPDGSLVRTASLPTGDLEAARRASGAAFVVSASSMAPRSRLLRGMLPAVLPLLKIKAVRDFARRRMAAIELKPTEPGNAKGRAFYWTHARVEWSSGATREGWLQVDSGMVFTANVMAEVAARLLHRAARPGAYTPGALFGSELATAAGGRLILDA